MKKLGLLLILSMIMLCGCTKQSRWQEQYDLGMQYLEEGNYDEAIVAFAAAIKIEPNQALAYVGRGGAYIGSGETEENLEAALADYQKAIELDEQNVDAYLGVADVYIRRAEYDMALEILQEGEKKAGDELITEKIAEIESGSITDSYGNIRKMSGYDETGALNFSEMRIFYDEDGLIVREEFYEEDHKISYLFEHDEEGNVTQRDDYKDEVWDGAHAYEYDGQGRVIHYTDYGNDGQIWAYVIYEYDKNGNKSQAVHYGVDDEILARIVYEYDEEGTLANQKEYDGEGNLRESVTRE